MTDRDPMVLRFCGAVQGTAKMRKGETPDQALARVEATILRLVDLRGGKGLHFNLGLEHDET